MLTTPAIIYPAAQTEVNLQHIASSESHKILANIYQEDINLAVWQKTLSENIKDFIQRLIIEKPKFRAIMTVTPTNVHEYITECFTGIGGHDEICQHISLLVDMFCTLFDLEYTGLRLKLLDSPMCPKFHVDKVPCRLVSTLYGSSTQWLTNNSVNRTKLGAGGKSLPDESSGIILQPNDIQQLSSGDVALLKGESWFNNEGSGLVHRSPILFPHEHRLLLTLDFAE